MTVLAMRRVDHWSEQLETWWKAQLPRTRVGLAIIAVVVASALLSIAQAQMLARRRRSPSHRSRRRRS